MPHQLNGRDCCKKEKKKTPSLWEIGGAWSGTLTLAVGRGGKKDAVSNAVIFCIFKQIGITRYNVPRKRLLFTSEFGA